MMTGGWTLWGVAIVALIVGGCWTLGAWVVNRILAALFDRPAKA